jgi:hypothetical protein
MLRYLLVCFCFIGFSWVCFPVFAGTIEKDSVILNSCSADKKYLEGTVIAGNYPVFDCGCNSRYLLLLDEFQEEISFNNWEDDIFPEDMFFLDPTADQLFLNEEYYGLRLGITYQTKTCDCESDELYSGTGLEIISIVKLGYADPEQLLGVIDDPTISNGPEEPFEQVPDGELVDEGTPMLDYVEGYLKDFKVSESMCACENELSLLDADGEVYTFNTWDIANLPEDFFLVDEMSQQLVLNEKYLYVRVGVSFDVNVCACSDDEEDTTLILNVAGIMVYDE